MAKYYLIDCFGGETYIQEFTKQEILKLMDEWRELKEPPAVIDAIPNTDPTHWGNKAVIIKGEIVIPHTKQVTEYEID